ALFDECPDVRIGEILELRGLHYGEAPIQCSEPLSEVIPGRRNTLFELVLQARRKSSRPDLDRPEPLLALMVRDVLPKMIGGLTQVAHEPGDVQTLPAGLKAWVTSESVQ